MPIVDYEAIRINVRFIFFEPALADARTTRHGRILRDTALIMVVGRFAGDFFETIAGNIGRAIECEIANNGEPHVFFGLRIGPELIQDLRSIIFLFVVSFVVMFIDEIVIEQQSVVMRAIILIAVLSTMKEANRFI